LSYRMLIFSFVLLGLSACTIDIHTSNNRNVDYQWADAAEDLHDLFEREKDYRDSTNPFRAEDDDPRGNYLPSASPAFFAEQAQQNQEFLDDLHSINRDDLSDEDQLNYDLFEFVVGHRVKAASYRPYRIPLLSDSGFHMRFLRMHEMRPMKTVADYERFTARLHDMGRYFDENITNMRTGMTEGYIMPRAILDNIVPSISAHIVERPEDSAFFSPFESFPDSINEADKARLLVSGRRAIMDSVVPAYRRFHAFFTGEYIPAARETIGINSVPGGEDYYRYLVKFYTTLDISPEEVHELGKREMARIRAEMEDIIAEVGFEGSFAEFLEFLRTDSQFYADSPEQLLKEASWIAKRIDGRLPGYFGKLPRTPYGVRAVPDDIAPNYTTGRYWGTSKGSALGGFFMVNTYALDKRPLYTLAALALHEGMPGHHLQNALNQEQEDVPEFRQRLYPHAYGEGWGLYTEKLGVEMGIYQTPYEHFGRLTYEMWRAGRLVVDTGMHFMGMSRDEAVQLFVENSALSLHNINTEVDRYISWPGQALAYKMGEIALWRLRAKAEDALGDDFDVRDFHDAVMANGALPLEILERQIDAYIADKKADNNEQ